MRFVRFVYAVLRDSLAGNLPLRAMGLVYVTILAIVPLLAISFSVLKAFGFHRQMQPALEQLFAPLGERGAELTARILGFVENAQGDALAAVGVLLLFFTTLSMAQRVEDSFNFIWRVEHSRNLAQRVSEYLSVILLGPVVMVTAMTLIGMVRTHEVVERAAEFEPVGSALVTLGVLAPYALVVLGFSFVYWFLPNTRVRVGAALVGGLSGGVLWASASVLFAAFVAESTRTLTIYSSFAILIIALLWLYFCWLILLVGAQISFYFQHPENLRLGYRPVYLGNRRREQIALSVMSLLARSFRDERTHPTLEDLSQRLGLSVLAMLPTVRRLEETGLVLRTEDNRLMPSRDPQQIRLTEVLSAVREPPASDIFPEGRWPDGVRRYGARFEEALHQSLGEANLYDLIGETEAPAGGAR